MLQNNHKWSGHIIWFETSSINQYLEDMSGSRVFGYFPVENFPRAPIVKQANMIDV